MMEYKLIRSKRKTVAIYIKDNGKVEVRAPLKCPLDIIDDFVKGKSLWIEKHAEISKVRFHSRQGFLFEDRAELLLLGISYPVIHGEKVRFDGNAFILPDCKESDKLTAVKKELISFYRRFAEEYIAGRVRHYSLLMKCEPLSVKITSAKTRWGSCSGRNSLNFSWRLIMAGEKSIDYVVVHELAHIRYHNHSNAFWDFVGEIFPCYHESKKELKLLSEKLVYIDM